MALKEDAIYVELSTRIQELKGAVGPDVDDLKHDVAIIQGDIPSNASSENKLATAADVNYIALGLEALSGSIVGIQSIIPDTATSENQLATAADISSIEEVIPSSASSENKLATAADIPATVKKRRSITLDGTKSFTEVLETELVTMLVSIDFDLDRFLASGALILKESTIWSIYHPDRYIPVTSSTEFGTFFLSLNNTYIGTSMLFKWIKIDLNNHSNSVMYEQTITSSGFTGGNVSSSFKPTGTLELYY